GLAAGTERLPGNLLLLEFRGLPGAAGADPVPAWEGRETPLRSHAERLRARRGANFGRDPRAVPARGRQRGDPRSASSLPRRRRKNPRSGGVEEESRAFRSILLAEPMVPC